MLINATRDIFYFVKNENIKNEHVVITRKKICRKNKKNKGGQFYNIDIVVFAFLF